MDDLFLDDEVILPPYPPTFSMSTSLEDQLYHDHVTGAFVDFVDEHTGLTPTNQSSANGAASGAPSTSASASASSSTTSGNTPTPRTASEVANGVLVGLVRCGLQVPRVPEDAIGGPRGARAVRERHTGAPAPVGSMSAFEQVHVSV